MPGCVRTRSTAISRRTDASYPCGCSTASGTTLMAYSSHSDAGLPLTMWRARRTVAKAPLPSSSANTSSWNASSGRSVGASASEPRSEEPPSPSARGPACAGASFSTIACASSAVGASALASKRAASRLRSAVRARYLAVLMAALQCFSPLRRSTGTSFGSAVLLAVLTAPPTNPCLSKRASAVSARTAWSEARLRSSGGRRMASVAACARLGAASHSAAERLKRAASFAWGVDLAGGGGANPGPRADQGASRVHRELALASLLAEERRHRAKHRRRRIHARYQPRDAVERGEHLSEQALPGLRERLDQARSHGAERLEQSRHARRSVWDGRPRPLQEHLAHLPPQSAPERRPARVDPQEQVARVRRLARVEARAHEALYERLRQLLRHAQSPTLATSHRQQTKPRQS
mmetsp:Transcript_1950/g.7154  ORF Transcript_1950/g.7154 Transcript_1950/m.7154 type:complete len:408 (+) Transcript_1950:1257-2480(+)